MHVFVTPIHEVETSKAASSHSAQGLPAKIVLTCLRRSFGPQVDRDSLAISIAFSRPLDITFAQHQIEEGEYWSHLLPISKHISSAITRFAVPSCTQPSQLIYTLPPWRWPVSSRVKMGPSLCTVIKGLRKEQEWTLASTLASLSMRLSRSTFNQRLQIV